MQQTLSIKEIVDTFPGAKTTVKRLIRETESFLEEARKAEQDTREFLSTRVNMYDIDICTKVVMAAGYGERIQKAETELKRLYRLLYTYEPPTTATPGLITDEEIQRARSYPIKELLPVRGNTAKCPFHKEKTASLHVYKDNHSYCFGCHKRADSIDVTMNIQGLGFVEAVKWLNRL